MDTMHCYVKDVQGLANRLVEMCHDGQEGYSAAARILTSQELKTELFSYSRQRGQFVSQLEFAMESLGQVPARRGTATGALHRGWMNLKRVLTAGDERSILNECLHGEESAIAVYREAIEANLPSPFDELIKTQLQEIQRVYNRVLELRASVNPNDPA